MNKLLKKLLAGMTAVVLSATIAPAMAFADESADLQAAGTFPDVPADAWYANSVEKAVEAGIIKGYGTGNFGPLDTLSRAQAATILWRYYTQSQGDKSVNTTGMADVEVNQYYTAAANWAVQNKIISGKQSDDGTRYFDPNGVISREQLCVIVGNCAKYYGWATVASDCSNLDAMADAGSVSSWARNSVAWAVDAGVIKGSTVDGVHYVNSGSAVDRATMATVTMRSVDNGVFDKNENRHLDYVTVIGTDAWNRSSQNDFTHLEGTDLQMLLRIDYDSNTVSMVSVARDIIYDNATVMGTEPGKNCGCANFGAKQCDGKSFLKTNYAFHYGFYSVFDGTNYVEANKAGAEKACEMMSDLFGVKVTDYAVVDLYTYQDIVDRLNGLTVVLPFDITNFTFYAAATTSKSGEDPVSLSYGKQTLNGWNAMVASRARVPYVNLTDQTQWHDAWLKLARYDRLDQEAVRQFVNRRAMTSLMRAGLKLNNASFVTGLVDSGLIWTNLSTEQIAEKYNMLQEGTGNITVYASAVDNLDNGERYWWLHGRWVTDAELTTEQIEWCQGNGIYKIWLYPRNETAFKNISNQLKSGSALTSGFGSETSKI